MHVYMQQQLVEDRVAELEEEIEELKGAVTAAEATGSDEFVDVRGWRPD